MGKLFLISLFVSVAPMCVRPQDIVEKRPELIVRARVKNNEVKLRWATNDKMAWKYGNQYGYSIERTTIMRNGSILGIPEKKLLSGNVIKPKPLNDWEALVLENNNAAIVAQAIYGEGFSVNDENENVVMKVINESSELEQRFAFSLFAVDQDFQVAQYAGLGFVDTDVRPTERYLYTVKMAAPDEIIKVEEKIKLIQPTKAISLPKPYDFAAYSYNNAFVLIWEYDDLLPYYTSYTLEKSEDGIEFSQVNSVPITKLAVTEVSGISYTDSIAEYGKKYWYRVRGRSLFNEVGPPSDSVSVIAFKQLLAAPEFQNNLLLSEKEVVLNWTFPQDEAWKLTGFDLLRSDKAIGPYQAVVEAMNKDTRTYTYDKVRPINYFKLRAKGIASDVQDSSPTMVQPVDSIPPLSPQGLTGTVDTLGIVRLFWQENKELDLKGYTLLRSDRAMGEFTRMNKQELTKNSYVDTINLKTFYSNVHYKLLATDMRYNESKPSEILILERPSTIPPSSPVFSGYQVLTDTVKLQWVPSSSDHVVNHVVYRKEEGGAADTRWQRMASIQDISQTTYADTDIVPNQNYLYTLTAENKWGIESAPSPPIGIGTQKKLTRDAIKGFYAQVDREQQQIRLYWRYSQPNITEIRIYRKATETEFSLYKVLPAETKRFTDTVLVPNTDYQYGIKAIFGDGTVSKWSKLSVEY